MRAPSIWISTFYLNFQFLSRFSFFAMWAWPYSLPHQSLFSVQLKTFISTFFYHTHLLPSSPGSNQPSISALTPQFLGIALEVVSGPSVPLKNALPSLPLSNHFNVSDFISPLISGKLHFVISFHLICTCSPSKIILPFIFLRGIIISLFIRLMQSTCALDCIFYILSTFFFFWLLPSLPVEFLRFVWPANHLSPILLISQFFILLSFLVFLLKLFKMRSPVT